MGNCNEPRKLQYEKQKDMINPTKHQIALANFLDTIPKDLYSHLYFLYIENTDTDINLVLVFANYSNGWVIRIRRNEKSSKNGLKDETVTPEPDCLKATFHNYGYKIIFTEETKGKFRVGINISDTGYNYYEIRSK